MAFERHHSTLIVASLITVASFVAATAHIQNRLARLDALSSIIETNAVPSIEYLSRASTDAVASREPGHELTSVPNADDPLDHAVRSVAVTLSASCIYGYARKPS